MIYPRLPTPIELSEDPELAVLVTLATNLAMARFAILAAYPDLEHCDPDSRHSQTEQDAYANAIFKQLAALGDLLEEYIASVRRLRSPKSHQPSGKDISF